jgi:hypothetical protein
MKFTTSAHRLAYASPGSSPLISKNVRKARNAHAPEQEKSGSPAAAVNQTNP